MNETMESPHFEEEGGAVPAHPEETVNPQEIVEAKETPEAVMDRAKNGRAEILQQTFLSKAIKLIENPLFLKAVVNHIPIVGDYRLVAGAIRGKDAGRDLSAGERLNYVLAVSTSALSVACLYEGRLTEAGIGEMVTQILLNIDTIPIALKDAAKAVENKFPKLAGILDASGDYINTKRNELADMGKLFSREPILTLGLNNTEA